MALVPVKVYVVTVTVRELLLDIVLLQLPLDKFLMVMVEFPAVVNPVAVKLPVPAVVTTIVAVSPVAAGELRS